MTSSLPLITLPLKTSQAKSLLFLPDLYHTTDFGIFDLFVPNRIF